MTAERKGKKGVSSRPSQPSSFRSDSIAQRRAEQAPVPTTPLPQSRERHRSTGEPNRSAGERHRSTGEPNRSTGEPNRSTGEPNRRIAPPSVESFRDEFAPDFSDEPRPSDATSFLGEGGSEWGADQNRLTEAPPPPSWVALTGAVPPGARRDSLGRSTTRSTDERSADERSAEPWTTQDTAPQSPGYYSVVDERAEKLNIPPAPRVPRLGLDGAWADATDEDGFRGERGRTSREAPTEPPETTSVVDVFDQERGAVALSPSDGTLMEDRPSALGFSGGTAGSLNSEEGNTIPTPPLDSEFPETEPPPIWRVSGDSFRPPPAPRLYFSPHVRQQANEWARTGSLSLPGCSSPRHARAVQRALLLALLTEPGWDDLPHGLRQRAGWLFCDEWDTSSAHGHASREVDDLATVLSMPATEDTRELLRQSVLALLPAGSRAPRASRPPRRHSSPPPSRRGSTGPSRPGSKPAHFK